MIPGEVVMLWLIPVSCRSVMVEEHGIDPSPVNVGFVVDKVTLRQGSL